MVGIRIESVTKRFGDVTAVDAAEFEIAKGELFFLLGPSGCGKTTLLRLIAGFHRPDSGRIFFDERPIDNVPPHKRNTGMVFQSYALWPHMTVAENVAYGLDVRRVPPSERDDRVGRALETVRMAAYADRRPNQLSGGQQQRVAVARALVVEPDAILLDEPLSNLDAKLRVEMRQEIRRIHRETGITTVYVTHDQKEALSMAQRLAVMRDGKIEQVGAPREVYTRPRNTFVAQFIGEINFIEGTLASGPGEAHGAQPPSAGKQTQDAQSGATVVHTAIGDVVAASSPPGLSPGDSVLCAIRPEAMVVAPEREAGHEVNAFAAKVETQTYLGEVEQYALRAASGLELKAAMLNPGDGAIPPGQNATVSFAREDVVILKKDG